MGLLVMDAQWVPWSRSRN